MAPTAVENPPAPHNAHALEVLAASAVEYVPATQLEQSNAKPITLALHVPAEHAEHIEAAGPA